MALFATPFTPDIDGLIRNLKREGTPDRVFHMELYLDREIHEAVKERFSTAPGLAANDPHYPTKMVMANYRFLGYECFIAGPGNMGFPREHLSTADTVEGSQSRGERTWVDENMGVIASWEDFEKYPWPDIRKADTSELEWLNKNLPADMGGAGCCHSIFEEVSWLMGYANLCYKIFDEPDLVDAMFKKVGGIFLDLAELLVQFDCIKLFFGGDDMGFKTGTMIQADILREKCLPWHKKITEVIHKAGRINVLHSCGNLFDILDDLIDDVKYDAKHSFEDTIEMVTDAKRNYGKRLSLVGGIDVDFLCRRSEAEIRKRVRETLDICQPGGGYCLGSGNTVANYIPLDNYLAMVDEGRRYSA